MRSESFLPPSSPKEFQLFQPRHTRHCRRTGFCTHAYAHTRSLGRAHHPPLKTPLAPSGLSRWVRKDFGTPATQRGKKPHISKHGWCLQVVPTFCPQRDKASVPNWAWGGGQINSTVKKGFQKFYSSRIIFFFFFPSTGSKISDFIRIVISRQVDFKPGLKFPFQFFSAKLKV